MFLILEGTWGEGSCSSSVPHTHSSFAAEGLFLILSHQSLNLSPKKKLSALSNVSSTSSCFLSSLSLSDISYCKISSVLFTESYNTFTTGIYNISVYIHACMCIRSFYWFRNAKGCVSENVRWYALISLYCDSSAKKQTEQLVFSSSAVLAGDEWMLYWGHVVRAKWFYKYINGFCEGLGRKKNIFFLSGKRDVSCFFKGWLVIYFQLW